jgi:hypothetical protein
MLSPCLPEDFDPIQVQLASLKAILRAELENPNITEQEALAHFKEAIFNVAAELETNSRNVPQTFSVLPDPEIQKSTRYYST